MPSFRDGAHRAAGAGAFGDSLSDADAARYDDVRPGYPPEVVALLADADRAGAALDVFRTEPDVDPRLAAAPNVLPLPHIGSATVETRAAMGALQRQNLTAVLAGKAAVTPVTAA